MKRSTKPSARGAIRFAWPAESGACPLCGRIAVCKRPDVAPLHPSGDNNDEILSRDELATLVWGYQDASSGRTIDVHIRRLRVKLTAGPIMAPAIVAVRGFGYKMAFEDAVTGAHGAAA